MFVPVKVESCFLCTLSLNKMKNIIFIHYFHYKSQGFYSARCFSS